MIISNDPKLKKVLDIKKKTYLKVGKRYIILY